MCQRSYLTVYYATLCHRLRPSWAKCTSPYFSVSLRDRSRWKQLNSGLDLKGEVMGSYVNGAGGTAISAFLHRANDKTTGQGGQQCKLGSSNCTLVTDKRKLFIHMGYASRLDTMTTGVTYINCLLVPLQLSGDGIRSGRRPRRCASLWVLHFDRYVGVTKIQLCNVAHFTRPCFWLSQWSAKSWKRYKTGCKLAVSYYYSHTRSHIWAFDWYQK